LEEDGSRSGRCLWGSEEGEYGEERVAEWWELIAGELG
jgi:hypothetical protein